MQTVFLREDVRSSLINLLSHASQLALQDQET